MSKKSQELTREIEIPQDIEASVENNEIVARKEGKEIKRKFKRVILEKQESKLIIKMKGATKREKKQINTVVAHIKNMLQGLKEKFVYKLQICSVHFPINVSVKNNEVVIKNFLGESKERKAKISKDAEVKIEKELITVESFNKEAAGQTAGNIEKSTKTKNKDKRVFQDGIYLVSRAGKGV